MRVLLFGKKDNTLSLFPKPEKGVISDGLAGGLSHAHTEGAFNIAN